MPDWTPENPLERTSAESPKANAALRDYALMGPGRSLLKLSDRYRTQSAAGVGPNPPTVRLATLKNWSSAYEWQARVDAWDRIQQEEQEAEWAARRREIREKDWQQGVELRDLAARILAEGPSFIKTRRRTRPGSPRVIDAAGKVISPGEPEQEIITLALDGQLLIRAAKTGSDLQRLAAEMETERQTIDAHTTLSGTVTFTPEVDLSAADPDHAARYLLTVSSFAADLAARLTNGSFPTSSESGPDADR